MEPEPRNFSEVETDGDSVQEGTGECLLQEVMESPRNGIIGWGPVETWSRAAHNSNSP